jgi:prepilin-type N-terminal cleavage/methylation domain-containing protein
MSRSAFTFIEVLVSLLVLSIGFTAAVGVARYGVAISQDAISASLALPTARAVLADARLDETATDGATRTAAVLDWTRAGQVWTGNVNGLYVRRTIVGPVQRPASSVALAFATVRVEVFWSGDSGRSITIQERMCFHAP